MSTNRWIAAAWLLTSGCLVSDPGARGAAAPRPAPALSEWIAGEMARLHIPGAAVAVLEHGELAWARGFGFADLERQVPVRPDTRFMIGSTSKVFLGVAVLQQEERGKLELDDPVVKHLPALGAAYADVTIRQLLSHTAGIRRDAKRRGPPPYLDHQVYGEDLVALLAESGLEFEPGADARYSNLGPALLARIVESTTGQPIDEYLQTAVFAPAGMKHTAHLRKTDDPGRVARMAIGTVWTGSRHRAGGYESRFPTGSIVSTVTDLAAFMDALSAGRLLRPQALERMWQAETLRDGRKADLGRDGVGRRYAGALGWFVHETDGRAIVHHGGSMEGFSSQIDVDRGSGRTVIVLANNEAGPAGDLSWALLERLNAGGKGEASDDPVAPLLQEVPFDSERWEVDALQSRVGPHRGRTSLYLRDGTAWIRDAEWADGVVEVDVAFTDERGFIGVRWRMQGQGNHEEFYVRPHQSGNPDANQYTPAFDGLTSWQLYHGAGYGAPVEYRYDDWNKVRIVVSGDRAEIFVNDMERPALFVPGLKREKQAGRTGISAFSAPAHFSGFRFHAGSPPALRSALPEPPPPVPGSIRTWEVSDTFDWAMLRDTTGLPARLADSRTWSTLESEASGLVNLAQVASRGPGRNAVFARVTLDSERDRTVRLRFGYSDRARVYLNGRALYAGDNGYRSRDYRYLGTIGYFDELFLPLRSGENRLWFAVGEDFGGWGLQAILDDADGIVVRP